MHVILSVKHNSFEWVLNKIPANNPLNFASQILSGKKISLLVSEIKGLLQVINTNLEEPHCLKCLHTLKRLNKRHVHILLAIECFFSLLEEVKYWETRQTFEVICFTE